MQPSMEQSYVLVTGAGSGIGKAICEELASLGFHVYAGLKEMGQVEFIHNSIEAIKLDVTSKSDIEAVTKKLQEKNLYAVINNAGVADFHPVELVPEKTLRKIFDVNFFGPVLLIQNLLPLLRNTKGRILNIGSMGAHTTIPFGFALCSSKHAIKSLTDALRIELQQDEIEVIEVDPSSIATPASAQMYDQISEITESFTDMGKRRYQKPMLSMGKSMHSAEMAGMPPEGVAKVVGEALCVKNPKPFYSVGPNSSKITFLSKLMPPKVFDKIKLKLVGIKMAS